MHCAAWFFFLLLSLPFPPSAIDIKSAVAALESRYRSAKLLQATFLEEYFENGRLVRSEAGDAYFLRPGKMRWEYSKPEKKVFLVDGKTAWFYVPADHTVTRVPAKRSTDWRTPLALLAGEMKLSRICARVAQSLSEPPSLPGNVVLSCTPKGATSKAPSADSASAPPESLEILIEVQPTTGDIARISVHQPGSTTIDFHFENWQFDPPVPASWFRFEPPPGTAIVNGQLPDREIPVNPPTNPPLNP
jgi:outer membrane lipoprotein carrier protein